MWRRWGVWAGGDWGRVVADQAGWRRRRVSSIVRKTRHPARARGLGGRARRIGAGRPGWRLGEMTSEPDWPCQEGEGARSADWIALLGSSEAAWRREAALVLGDWLYPRGGMPDAEVLTLHQALLDAALRETDEEACRAQLNALTRSNRTLAGVTGWDRLVERAPDMASGPQELALALLSITGESGFADRLEVLAAERAEFDHALTRKTIAGIRASVGDG